MISLGRIALDAFRAGIPTGYDAVRVEHVERVVGYAVHQQAELPFAFTQGLSARLRSVMSRVILAKPISLPGGTMYRIHDDGCPKPASILTHAPAFGFISSLSAAVRQSAGPAALRPILLGCKTG